MTVSVLVYHLTSWLLGFVCYLEMGILHLSFLLQNYQNKLNCHAVRQLADGIIAFYFWG